MAKARAALQSDHCRRRRRSRPVRRLLTTLTLPSPSDPHRHVEQVGDIPLIELSKHDGRDPLRPLLLAVRGRVFDVTPGRSFYGPGEWPGACRSGQGTRLASA